MSREMDELKVEVMRLKAHSKDIRLQLESLNLDQMDNMMGFRVST